MSVWRRITAGLLAVAAGAVVFGPAVALAQDYDLTFTLPTAGKSGCMVCHADTNLGRLQGSEWISYWVDPEPLDSGPHAGIMCTGCHLDFAYKSPHNIEQTDWVRTAKLACKNCHQEQWESYSAGVHSIAVQPGEQIAKEDQDKPLCGDCHGAHEIKALTDNPEGKADLHARGKQVCGDCHEDYWESYQDYYHGAAYREGASDAPVCWQCHGYHDILPTDDRRSTVNGENLEVTCSTCHKTASGKYLGYAGIVHQRQKAYAENPIYSTLENAKDSIREFFGQIRSWFT